MRTVGEILKKARTEKKLTLDDIEKNLRIRKKFLIALEENAWDKLPSLPYIKGFLRSYSDYLDLKSEEIIAIFRRQFSLQEKSGLLPDGLAHPMDEPTIRFTPQLAAFAIIFSFVILFFGYLFLQYRAYISPPNLVVTKPAEGEIMLGDKIAVAGKTDNYAVVSINNQKIAVSQNGEFSTTLSLPPGINTILIESTSKFGKKKSVTRTIQVQ